MDMNNYRNQYFIAVYFIRDDQETLALGVGAYPFGEDVKHFKAPTIKNDIVEMQGRDGQLLAGQVRRPATEEFTGFIGSPTMTKTETETARSAFIDFFATPHFYTVVYLMPDGTNLAHYRGFLTAGPEIKELYQQTPEYSVSLSFEETNLYTYTAGA